MKKITAIILTLVMLLCSLGVTSFAAEEKPFYVVLGDSIAYGSGLANPVNACYGKIVADTNGYEYANHSVPGHTTTNLLARLTQEAVARDVANADIINISIGGNDFLLGNIIDLVYQAMVNENYDRFDEIAESFYVNLGAIVEKIRELNSDALILIQTLYNPQSGYLRDPYQQGADRINAALERYTQENPDEIVIVDVAPALGDDMANYAGDSIHPSAKGNKIIAQQVLNKLYELGAGTSTQPVITEKGKDVFIPVFFTVYVEFYAFIFHIIAAIRNFFINLF